VRRILLPVLLVCVFSQACADDLTCMTYNILNYSSSTGAPRAPYFRTVITSVAPDMIICQELMSYSGRNHFLTEVLDVVEPGAWTVAPFHDGYDTDRGLFYKPALLEVLDSGWLDTTLRDIDWWHLRELESGVEFRVFTCHLKASQGSDNEQQRLAEATVLRNFLAGLPADLPVVVAGDFNLYYSAEPAYQLLTSPGDAQLFDPIDRPGYWHNIHGIAVHPETGRVFVNDRTNKRVHVFDSDGNYLYEWSFGPEPTDIHDFMITADGFLWAADRGTNKMLKYDLDGNFLYAWGTWGDFPGGMWGVHGISVDEEQNFYVAEVDNGGFQKYVPRQGANPDMLVGPPVRSVW